MSNQPSSKSKVQILKELRAMHADTVNKAQAQLKAQQAIRKSLKQAMINGPMTVPEIAAAVELPSETVLWHLVAMKKYDLVVETGQSGEYYQCALAGAKETKA